MMFWTYWCTLTTPKLNQHLADLFSQGKMLTKRKTLLPFIVASDTDKAVDNISAIFL